LPEILGKKIGGSDLLTIFVAGATKTVEERMLARIIGNGTVLSGVIKLAIGGWGIPMVAGSHKSNSIVRGVALGFGVDGVEDIIQGLFFGGGIMSGGIFGGDRQGAVI
jgi:hypothetical protein